MPGVRRLVPGVAKALLAALVGAVALGPGVTACSRTDKANQKSDAGLVGGTTRQANDPGGREVTGIGPPPEAPDARYCTLDSDSRPPTVTDVVDLPEARRRAVFQELLELRATAKGAAELRFKDPQSGLSSVGPANARKVAAVRRARENEARVLELRRLAELQAREHLSCDALRSVFWQGTTLGWTPQ